MCLGLCGTWNLKELVEVSSLKRWEETRVGRRGAKQENDFSGMGQLANHHDNETVIPFDLIFILAILYFYYLYFVFLTYFWVCIYFISFAFYLTSSFQSGCADRCSCLTGEKGNGKCTLIVLFLTRTMSCAQTCTSALMSSTEGVSMWSVCLFDLIGAAQTAVPACQGEFPT